MAYILYQTMVPLSHAQESVAVMPCQVTAPTFGSLRPESGLPNYKAVVRTRIRHKRGTGHLANCGK